MGYNVGQPTGQMTWFQQMDGTKGRGMECYKLPDLTGIPHVAQRGSRHVKLQRTQPARTPGAALRCSREDQSANSQCLLTFNLVLEKTSAKQKDTWDCFTNAPAKLNKQKWGGRGEEL